MNGAGRSALAGVDTTAVWWSDEEDRHLVRFSMSLTSTIRFTATVTVLGADGTPAPRSPEPVVSWQESMRYFRMSELTDDLFDAFRNVYLALESLLSKIEPHGLKRNPLRDGSSPDRGRLYR